jgi:peptide/nickel transport system substrate-binding protein
LTIGLPFPDWEGNTVYQSLTSYNVTAEYANQNLTVIPDLALNYTSNPNQTIWTFNLPHNATFSNGDPFNSYEVWADYYGYYWVADNASNFLFGYEPFNMSTADFGPSTLAMLNSSSTSLSNPSPALLKIMENESGPWWVNGPDQISFRSVGPNPYLPGMLGSLVAIYDAQYVLNNGGFGPAGEENNYFASNAIPGTGPYELAGYSENAYEHFVQDPTYWGRSLPQSAITANPLLAPGNVQSVFVYYKPDDLTRYTDLQDGTVQMAELMGSTLPIAQTDPSQYSYEQLSSFSALDFGLAMNVQSYPTNITDVRLAIAHAINLTQIVDSVFGGKVTPWDGPELPAWSQYYDLGGQSQYSYNLTLSKQLLSGLNVASFPTLQFAQPVGCTYCTDTDQLIQQDLTQIGLKVSIELQSYEAYETPYQQSWDYRYTHANQTAQLSLLGGENWADPTITPIDNFDAFVYSQGFGNWAIYNSTVCDQFVNSWFANPTNTTYLTGLGAQCQSQVYQAAPYVWIGDLQLFFGDGSIVWNNHVISGFVPDPLMGDIPPLQLLAFASGASAAHQPSQPSTAFSYVATAERIH